MPIQQKITPCLWFDDQAEEAVNFYVSVFSGSPKASREGGKNSKIGEVLHYDKDSAKVSGMPEGSVLTISFQLAGQDFLALNGGPAFQFTEAISFIVDCSDQEEVDYYWEKLSAVPASEQCGWLKDKYGVSWQITPRILNELLADKDAFKAQRAMKAMLGMKKLDVAELQKAFDGE